MGNSSSSRCKLHSTFCNVFHVAHWIFMSHSPSMQVKSLTTLSLLTTDNVWKYLIELVGVCSKPTTSLNTILVQDAKTAVAFKPRIKICCKRKAVVCIQPSMICMTTLVSLSNSDERAHVHWRGQLQTVEGVYYVGSDQRMQVAYLQRDFLRQKSWADLFGELWECSWKYKCTKCKREEKSLAS